MGCLIFAGFMAVVFAIEFPWLWYVYFLFFALAMICLLVDKRQAAKEAQLKSKQEAERIISRELMHFSIRSGREEYSSQPIKEGLPCKVIVTGQDSLYPQVNDAAKIDAVYFFGAQQYTRHHGLLFDGEPAALFEEDPHTHTYSFPYIGTGRQLSIVLRLPQGRRSSTGDSDPLSVSIRTLTVAEEVEVKAQEEQQLREAIADQREELRRRALDLATLAHMEQDLLQPNHQQHFAVKHMAEIVTSWAEKWRKEYLALKVDAPFYALIQEQYPEVLEFYEARFAVARLAKRLAVEPTPTSKPKKTLDEVLAGIERYRQRELNKIRVKVEDQKAYMMQNLELLQAFTADLDGYDLDEDEREALIREFKERLLGGEEDQSNGFRQL